MREFKIDYVGYATETNGTLYILAENKKQAETKAWKSIEGEFDHAEIISIAEQNL